MDLTNATPELFSALAKAQAELENASKNAANPHFRSRYADLAEVLNTTRPVLARHGLSVLQSTNFDGELGAVFVQTVLAHASGGHVTATSSCTVSKGDAQALGSATTYLRRYALAAIAGIAQEDDDGNAAAVRVQPTASPDLMAQALARIAGAGDQMQLGEVGQTIAGLDVDEPSKKKLRAAFTARRKALEAAA